MFMKLFVCLAFGMFYSLYFTVSSPMLMTLSLTFLTLIMSISLVYSISFWAGVGLMLLYMSGLLMVFTYVSSLSKPQQMNSSALLFMFIGGLGMFIIPEMSPKFCNMQVIESYEMNYESFGIYLAMILYITIIVVKLVKPGKGALKL